jgi:hypothetical protein
LMSEKSLSPSPVISADLIEWTSHIFRPFEASYFGPTRDYRDRQGYLSQSKFRFMPPQVPETGSFVTPANRSQTYYRDKLEKPPSGREPRDVILRALRRAIEGWAHPHPLIASASMLSVAAPLQHRHDLLTSRSR